MANPEGTLTPMRPPMLDILRCPLDPTVRLEATDDGLVCTRCRLRFPVRETIPCLVPEEAVLPPGIDALSGLPCQTDRADRSSPLPGAKS